MDRLISEKQVLDVINEAIRLGRFYSGKEQTIAEIKTIPSAEPTDHAKAIKEYCKQRDILDDCCEDCPFQFYRGTVGICVLNYGLYPNEWFEPQESEDR